MNRYLLAERVEGAEILDEGLAGEREMRRSLDDLRRLNRWVWGVSSIARPLQRWLREAPKPVTLLDLGSGSGQLAQALARWATASYQAVRLLALDLTPAHLRHARRYNERCHTPHVHLLAADALCLPLADQSVDYVTSSLFLHHFDPPTLRRLLQECRRVARRGLLMSDLWRHPLPYALYKGTLEPLLVRSPVTRMDSATSFRRAYRPRELVALATPSLPDPVVTVRFPSFRVLLSSRWG